MPKVAYPDHVFQIPAAQVQIRIRLKPGNPAIFILDFRNESPMEMKNTTNINQFCPAELFLPGKLYVR